MSNVQIVAKISHLRVEQADIATTKSASQFRLVKLLPIIRYMTIDSSSLRLQATALLVQSAPSAHDPSADENTRHKINEPLAGQEDPQQQPLNRVLLLQEYALQRQLVHLAPA